MPQRRQKATSSALSAATSAAPPLRILPPTIAVTHFPAVSILLQPKSLPPLLVAVDPAAPTLHCALGVRAGSRCLAGLVARHRSTQSKSPGVRSPLHRSQHIAFAPPKLSHA